MRSIVALALIAACMIGSAQGQPVAPLSADQIAEKNVAALGGLEAWRKVQTLVWKGNIESSNARFASAGFELGQERPNHTRFEMTVMNQKSLRVYDGTLGYKLRLDKNGDPKVEPFTLQEAKYAHSAWAIDPPLVDYAAKGSHLSYQGMDQIQGRGAHRIGIKTATGETQTVWIDAQTFLDMRFDRISYTTAGVPSVVSVYYRDYETVEGLQFPATIEIGGSPGQPASKMTIARIVLNPRLEKNAFGIKPELRRRRELGPARPPAQQ